MIVVINVILIFKFFKMFYWGEGRWGRFRGQFYYKVNMFKLKIYFQCLVNYEREYYRKVFEKKNFNYVELFFIIIQINNKLKKKLSMEEKVGYDY